MKRITAVVVLLLLACGPGRMVVVNGRQVPYEEAAQSDFQLAKAALDDGKYDLAAQRFSAFVQRYKDSQLVDEALFRRAQALTKAGRLQESQAALQDFLEKHPTSPFKNSAALELAAVQSKLGQAGPPPAQLDTSQLSEKEKNQAAAALAESYARSGQPGEAMRWAARALESAPAQEHDARLKDFERALDAAPGRDIAKLVSDLDRKSPAWPAAALKLARIQLHLGDRSHARELASDIVSGDGQGPYATARTSASALSP